MGREPTERLREPSSLPRALDWNCLGILLFAFATWACEPPDVAGSAKPVPSPKEAATQSPASLCDIVVPPAKSEIARALPQRLGSLCSDPNANQTALGTGELTGVAEGCAALLGERCPLLLRRGVTWLSEHRYVDGAGGPETLRVVMLRFAGVESAYAHYTEDLLGDEHPSRVEARPLASVRLGAVQGDRATLLHGQIVVELTFASPRLTSAKVREAAAPLFDAMGVALEAALPGEALVPTSVASLPEAERIPYGTRFVLADALGVEGAGPGAFGYYQRNERRYQVYFYDAGDEGAASDVEKTLRRAPGFRKLEKMALSSFELDVGPEFGGGRFLVARVGGRLAGAGEDLIDVLEEREEVRERRRLSRLEKFRLVRDALSARPRRQ